MKRRRFGAINVIGSIRFVSYSALVERERYCIIAKDSSRAQVTCAGPKEGAQRGVRDHADGARIILPTNFVRLGPSYVLVGDGEGQGRQRG